MAPILSRLSSGGGFGFGKRTATAAAPAPGPDPYFNSVALLLDMDGNNGSNSFIDRSPTPITINANGACQTITSIKKFGTASGRFAANADYLSFSNSTMNFGTSDFTIEFWLYYDSSQQVSSYGTFFDNGGQGIFLSFGSPKTHLIFYSPSAGLGDTTGYPHGMVTLNWYHLAWVKNGNACKVYVDGVEKGSWTSNGGSMSPASGATARIGQYTLNASYTPGGYMDDFRITKGVARYTANFTPPTAALPTF